MAEPRQSPAQYDQEQLSSVGGAQSTMQPSHTQFASMTTEPTTRFSVPQGQAYYQLQQGQVVSQGSTAQPMIMLNQGAAQRARIIRSHGQPNYPRSQQHTVRYVAAAPGNYSATRPTVAVRVPPSSKGVPIGTAPTMQQGRYTTVPAQGSPTHVQPQIVYQTRYAQPQAPPSEDQEASAVAKCAKFFRTLITLANKNQRGAEVTRLVREVVSDKITARDFTLQLQNALQSVAQPNLEPFLQQTLPMIRRAIQNNKVRLAGVNAPEDSNEPAIYQQQTVTETAPMSIGTAPQQYVRPQQPQMVMATVSNVMVAPKQTPVVQTVTYQHQPGQPRPVMTQLVSIAGTSQDQQQTEVDRVSVGGVDLNEENRQLTGQSQEILQMPTRRLAQQISGAPPIVMRPPDISDTTDPTVILDRSQLLTLMGAMCRRKLHANRVKSSSLSAVGMAARHKLMQMVRALRHIAIHRSMKLPSLQDDNDARAKLRIIEQVLMQQQRRATDKEKAELYKLAKSAKDDDEIRQRAKEMRQVEEEQERHKQASAAAARALQGSSMMPRNDLGGYATQSTSIVARQPLAPARRPKTIHVFMRDLMAYLATDSHFETSGAAFYLRLTGKRLYGPENGLPAAVSIMKRPRQD